VATHFLLGVGVAPAIDRSKIASNLAYGRDSSPQILVARLRVVDELKIHRPLSTIQGDSYLGVEGRGTLVQWPEQAPPSTI